MTLNLPESLFACLLAIAGLTLAAPATAQDMPASPSPWSLNTYGTLGVAATDQERAGYRPNASHRTALYDDWSGRLDNRLGVQLSYKLSPELAVVGHVLTQRDGADQVSTDWLWGMLQWTPAPGWAVQAGRFQNTLFLTSDNLYVGYAHPWVRPPVELYSLGGESPDLDGIMLRYSKPWQDWQLGVTAHVAHARQVRPLYSYVNHPNSALALSLSNNDWLFRVSMLFSKTSFQSPRAQAVANLIAAQNPLAAADYQTGDLGVQRYANAGFRYEHHPWTVQGEVARTDLRKKTLPDQLAWYLTAAYSAGDFSPYLTYASVRGLGNLDENRLTGRASLAAQALLNAKRNDQQTLSLGVRWDFRAGMALKAQWDRVHVPAGQQGLLMNPLPAGQTRLNVVSVVLDWRY